MFAVIGIIVVFGCIVAGYLMEHGNIRVLIQPAELMIANGTSHFPLSEKDAPRTRVLIRSWLDQFFPTPIRARG